MYISFTFTKFYKYIIIFVFAMQVYFYLLKSNNKIGPVSLLFFEKSSLIIEYIATIMSMVVSINCPNHFELQKNGIVLFKEGEKNTTYPNLDNQTVNTVFFESS